MKQWRFLALPLLLAAGPTFAQNTAQVPAGAVRLPTTDEFSTRYHNPDGSYTAVIAARPIHRLTASGWQDLNGRLSSNGAYQGRAFAQLPGTSTGWASVDRDDHSLGFTLMRAASSPALPQPDGQTLLYPNVLPATDLALTAMPDGGIKETLTLRSRAAAPFDGTFAYKLQLQGLVATPVTDDSGSRVLLSDPGRGVVSPLLQIAPPFATDARGQRTDNCWYNLSDDQKSLYLVVDPNWLNSATYPVTIDPTVTSQPSGGTGLDTYVDSTNANTNYGTSTSLYVGTQTPATGAISLIRFNLDFVPKGATVTSASLGVTVLGGSSTSVNISSAVQPWDPRGLTYNTLGNNSSPTLITTQTIDPSNSSTWTVAVTSTVQGWYAGSSRNYGFVLSRASGTTGLQLGSDDNATTTNCPSLAVTYTAGSDPSTPTLAGAPRRWQSGIGLNPYQTLNLANGNVLTELPLVGWQGFGPAIDLRLVHNSQESPSNTGNISAKWQTNYGSRLDLTGAPSTITRIGPDGSRDAYTNPVTNNGVTTYTSPTGVYDEISYVSASSDYLLLHPNQVQDTYNSSGQLVSIADTALTTGNEVDLSYTSNLLTGIKDANPTAGNRRSLTLAYDGSNRLSTVTDPLSRVWTLFYNTGGDLQGVKLPRQTNVLSQDSLEYAYVFNYDANHNVIGIGEPDQNPTSASSWTYVYSTEYDEYSRGTVGLGRTGLTYLQMPGQYVSYNATSNPTASYLVDQTFVHHKYVFSGGLLQSVMRVNNPTASEGSWTGPTTTLSWDTSYNNLLDVRLPGNPSTLGGNTFWSVERTYDTTNTNPGSRGNPLSETVHTIDPGGSSEDTSLKRATSYSWDPNGHNRVYSVTSTASVGGTTVNHVAKEYYDGDTPSTMNRSGWKKLTETQRYDDSAPTTTWTEQLAYYSDSSYPGKVQTRTDANSNQWSYTFDSYGNETQVKSPLIGSSYRTTSYTWDSTAHLLMATKTDNLGTVFTYSYHNSGTNPDYRPTQTSVPGPLVDYEYWTPNGKITETQSNLSWDSGNTTQGVDDTFYTDGNTLTSDNQPYQSVNYYHDGMGRRLKMTYQVQTTSTYGQGDTNDNRTVTYGYDSLGELTSKTWSSPQSSSQTIDYSYDSSTGLMTQQTDPNSTRSLFTYNNLGEETQREHEHEVSGVWSDIANYALQFRADRLRTQIVLTGAGTYNYTQNLSYDAVGEMTEEDLLNSGGSLTKKQAYGFDSDGNRTSRDQTDGSGNYQQGEASTYDAGNELTQIKHYTGPPKTLSSTENFVAGTDFDNNGNQLVTTGGKSYSLAYYKDNRLHTLTGTGYSDTCSYCVDGRLAARGTMSFEYDGHERQQDQDSSQPVTWVPTVNEYFGGDLMIHYTYASGGTSPASITLTWMYMDPSGNVGVMTDTSGTVLATCTADLCGTSPQQNGTATTSEYQWGCTYGYSYRSTPKVYQIGERIYDPGQGRWMQQDPLSEGQGDWSYSANSPANAVDPSGLVCGPMLPNGTYSCAWQQNIVQSVQSGGSQQPAYTNFNASYVPIPGGPGITGGLKISDSDGSIHPYVGVVITGATLPGIPAVSATQGYNSTGDVTTGDSLNGSLFAGVGVRVSLPASASAPESDEYGVGTPQASISVTHTF